MITLRIAVRRARGIGGRIVLSFLLAGLGLALAGAGPTLAEDRTDPCAASKVRVVAGAGSAESKAMARVCARVGAVELTRACMTYYLKLTDPIAPSDVGLRARQAKACEKSMPGGSSLPDCTTGACEAAGPEVATREAFGPPFDPNAGVSLEAEPEQSLPEAEVAPVAVSEAEDVEVAELEAVATPASMSADEDDAARDFAFWAKISKSQNPSDYRSYLDAFPEGIFAPIAEARIGQTAAGGSDEPEVEGSEPDPQIPATPEALYLQARTLLDEAYQLEQTRWPDAIGRAVPLLEQSGQGGYAPAYLELAGLAENGIGMPPDRAAALSYYKMAAALGSTEAQYRALVLLGTAGDPQGFVTAFVGFYRAHPDLALQSLSKTGDSGAKSLQQFLKDEGYYLGALDGAFGAGSKSALAAFVSGAPRPDGLPAETETASGPPVDGLAVELQMALQRAGCFSGPVDGRWGDSSMAAIMAFNRKTGTRHPADHPSVPALAAVKSRPGLVCRF